MGVYTIKGYSVELPEDAFDFDKPGTYFETNQDAFGRAAMLFMGFSFANPAAFAEAFGGTLYKVEVLFDGTPVFEITNHTVSP